MRLSTKRSIEDNLWGFIGLFLLIACFVHWAGWAWGGACGLGLVLVVSHLMRAIQRS